MFKDYYVILPNFKPDGVDDFIKNSSSQPGINVADDFS